MVQQPPVRHGLLIIETSRSQSDTPQSVGFLWTSDQPDADPPTWQHTTLKTNTPSPGGIRARNPSKRPSADPRLRPRGTGIGHYFHLFYCYFSLNLTDSFCLSVIDRVQHDSTDFVVFLLASEIKTRREEGRPTARQKDRSRSQQVHSTRNNCQIVVTKCLLTYTVGNKVSIDTHCW
jgi:hypothetical protein